MVSTDFIKSDRRRDEFLRTCPDLVIVDEAHTCVRRRRSGGTARTQRYELVRALAADADRHLILVTATPHSGKDAAFRNLLGLLDPALHDLDLDQTTGRELLARHFVQRRRADIRQFLDEDTPFPPTGSPRKHLQALTRVPRPVRRRASPTPGRRCAPPTAPREQRVRWWSALALLRALASSPRAAAQTWPPARPPRRGDDAAEADALGRSAVLDLADDETLESVDVAPGADAGRSSPATPAATPAARLRSSGRKALEGAGDRKLDAITTQVKELLADGYDPIVFCRFIATAEYVAEHLHPQAGQGARPWPCVTGTLPPDERVARIAALADARRAGRCWSPPTACPRASTCRTSSTPSSTTTWPGTRPGTSSARAGSTASASSATSCVPSPSTARTTASTASSSTCCSASTRRSARPPASRCRCPTTATPCSRPSWRACSCAAATTARTPSTSSSTQKAADLDREWQSAAEREKASRTKYAQRAIQPDEVAAEVAEIRANLGTHAEVRAFTETALQALRPTIRTTPRGFTASTGPLPGGLRDALPPGRETGLGFVDDFPVAKGENVLHRTDAAVEAIASYVLESALDPALPADARPARRCAVVRTAAVETRTTLLLVRYRFHLTLPSRAGERTAVAEDAATLAFTSRGGVLSWLEPTRSAPCSTPRRRGTWADPGQYLTSALGQLAQVQSHLDAHGEALAEQLRASHRRVRAASGGVVRGLGVRAESPPDVLGVYVFLPVPRG